jgi:branched-chain amino acid transport system ATP-binding protein
MNAGTSALAARKLTAGYNKHPFLRDIDLDVRPGEVVALIGPNGAGKTTCLNALAGVLTPLSGTVEIAGVERTDHFETRARDGLALVAEERSVFMRMTVKQNLAVAGAEPEPALVLFPELEPLQTRKVGLLSGGEQQMLALAMALGRRPKVLLIDELSLGLAPLIVNRLLGVVRKAASADGVAILLVEQKFELALAVADRVIAMSDGAITINGPTAEVAQRVRDLENSYLGGTDVHAGDEPGVDHATDQGASHD